MYKSGIHTNFTEYLPTVSICTEQPVDDDIQAPAPLAVGGLVLLTAAVLVLASRRVREIEINYGADSRVCAPAL